MKTSRNPYKFYAQKLSDGRIKTIAISTYAGRTVRGSTICSPSDQYDENIGKEIAATRCAAKVAQKRLNRAKQKRDEAADALKAAKIHYLKMMNYYNDAHKAWGRAIKLERETY